MRIERIYVVMLLVLCGCDEPRGGGSPTDQGDPVVTADTAAARSDTVAARVAPEDGAASDSSWTHAAHTSKLPGTGIAVVEDLRVATHEGFDRIVVEFRDGILPGYSVHHPNEQIIECGSGHTIDLDSSQALEIRMEPARGYTEDGKTTVSHDDRSPQLDAIEEIRVICDFEAVFTIGAGTAGNLPFRVATLQNPARMVVDVRHPSP